MSNIGEEIIKDLIRLRNKIRGNGKLAEVDAITKDVMSAVGDRWGATTHQEAACCDSRIEELQHKIRELSNERAS